MDGFGDLLEDIRNDGGELMWVTKKKEFLENQFNKKRSPEVIKQEVLRSQTIRHAIDQILEANRQSETEPGKLLKKEDLLKESQDIINEMAHQFDLKYIRALGYALMKVFCKIYKHIYYNKDINSNLEVLKHSPTLLLPLHRSYMDFLLVSIICFHKNIQMPAIATGMDFMGLSFLSQVIRHCGAFYIRRSFGSDKLYWAIFNEYVQAHLLNCDRPLEFFIEGTRSRTSKSLPPKHGMLASCLELYLKEHRVYDIYLVPISLTYERLLEELLYSSELLGIPKPKESVSGLVKARTILSEDYGSIFINFGRPLSFREMIFHLKGSGGLYSSLTPNFIFELKPKQIKMIQSVCYTALLEMLKNQIIQPISLIATSLLLSMNKKGSCLAIHNCNYAINLENLSTDVENLRRILTNLGCKVYWPAKQDSNQQSKDIILANLKNHSNLFDFYDKTKRIDSFIEAFRSVSENDSKNSENYVLEIKKIKKSDETVILTETEIFEDAKNFIATCSYRNQLVCFLIRKSFTCNSLLSVNIENIQSDNNDFILGLDDAFDSYKFLFKLFNREFILKDGDEKIDFEDSINHLTHTNILKWQGVNKFEIIRLNLKNFIFMSRLFLSFLLNYNTIYSILIDENKSSFTDEKHLIKFVQSKAFQKLTSSKDEVLMFDLELLSLNLISNSVLTLRQFNILEKSVNKSEKKVEYFIKLNLLREIKSKLSKIIKQNLIRLNELKKTTGEGLEFQVCDLDANLTSNL